VRVKIDGKDNFISRLGRWDNPVAVAKAQALSAKIWWISNRAQLTDF